MKTLLIALLCSSFAMAARTREQTKLECFNQDDYTFFNISTDWGAEGQLVHNYSDARIICSSNFERVLTEKGTRLCYGTWTWDYDRAEGTVIDTLAQVEVTNDGNKITAKTTTSKSYGAREITIDCKITKTEIPTGDKQ